MIITGVEDFGLFAQGITIPAEGLVHIRTMSDDYYLLERETHSLVGQRIGKRYRLGDVIRCILYHVDEESRQLDLRLVESGTRPIPIPRPKNKPRPIPPRMIKKKRKKKRR